MLYGTPVPVLQHMLTIEDFAELMTYDAVWGLERHQELQMPEQAPPVAIEKMMQMRSRKGDAAPEWTPGPTSLNRRRGQSNATR